MPFAHLRGEAAGAGRVGELLRQAAHRLQARSPRRIHRLHTAAARLLVLGARASSSARLHAVAYACSSPQHHGHSDVCSSSRYSTGYCHMFQAATRSTDIPMRRTTIAGVSGTDRRYMAERERGRASDDRAV
jgi:hypothetical protein